MTSDDVTDRDRIEHDASLTRQDNYFGDSTKLNMKLYKSFINSSTDGITISFSDAIAYRKVILIWILCIFVVSYRDMALTVKNDRFTKIEIVTSK